MIFVLLLWCTVVFGVADCGMSDTQIKVTLVVEGGRKECFLQPVNKPEHAFVNVRYTVVSIDDHSIDILINGPNGSPLLSLEGVTETDQDFSTQKKGDYEFCFDNSGNSKFTLVLIQLNLLDQYMDPILSFAEKTAGELKKNFKIFDFATMKIMSNLSKIQRSMATREAVERRDRSLVESTFEGINFWGMLNTVVLVGAALVQVFLVRSILSEESKIGRVLRKGKWD